MSTTDVHLSSGRTIAHAKQANGSWLATPTSGGDEMTDKEWVEYCQIVRQQNQHDIQTSKRKSFEDAKATRKATNVGRP